MPFWTVNHYLEFGLVQSPFYLGEAVHGDMLRSIFTLG